MVTSSTRDLSSAGDIFNRSLALQTGKAVSMLDYYKVTIPSAGSKFNRALALEKWSKPDRDLN